jgi:hypothetical protein
MSNAGGMATVTRYTDMLAGNTVWNPWSPDGAYDALSTVTVPSGGVASVTFAGIPNTYKHLQIRAISAGTDNTNVRLRFNGDTASNYSFHGMQAGAGYGSGVYTNAGTTQTSALFFDQQLGNSTYYNATISDILDYTSTSKNKTIRTLSGVDNNTAGFIYFESGLWYKTPEAVTSITIYPFSGSFYVNSQFTLYGVK